jgi:hypothetical protein
MTKAASLAMPLALLFALGEVAAQTPAPLPGRNVNMVSGTTWPNGDPFLQRQNEPSIAVSTRNPLHLLAGSNDYRTMDLPGLDGTVNGDAWLGLFKSFDGGLTWQSGLLPGYPQDTSPEGTASPIHRDPVAATGYQGATDPVVRAGTNGLFFYAGIGLDRTVTAETSQFGASAVFVARLIDNNNRPNGDPIDYIDTRIIKADPGDVFIDKPWLAVDIPRPGAKTCTIPVTANSNALTQSFAGGRVYVTFTEVKGTGASQTARIMFSRSLDCGATWSLPIELSVGHQLNQGSAIAINWVTGDVYIAWRRFKTATQPAALLIVKSSDGGKTFTTPIKIADITPFDQSTSAIFRSMRTSMFPAMTVDLFGRVYVAWSQRGVGPYGAARIVMATSDGKVLTAVADDDDFDTKKNVRMAWSLPTAVDNPSFDAKVPITSGPGHQIMPSLTFGGGKLTLVYYALREDHTKGVYAKEIDPLTGKFTGRYVESREAAGDLPDFPDQVFNKFIAETSVDADGNLDLTRPLTRRHTIDVRVAQAAPANAPVFTATRLSQYRFGSRPGSGVREIEQLQYDPPLLPMFGCFNVPANCRPFFGDYIDVSPSPVFQTDPLGIWIANMLPSKAPVFQAAWTDNRDVRPPPDGDWANWAPPTSAFLDALKADPKTQQSLFDPLVGTRLECVVGGTQAGHRNQNIYNARIAQLYLSAKDNAKQLGGIKRAFSVSLANPTEVAKSYRLTLSFGRGVEASFLQFSLLTQLDVTVAPRSSISRTVFVLSNDKRARVTVTAAEITEPGGALVDGGLESDLILNPDITNPDITNPDITNAEEYNPDITNPDITNPDITNPDITNPDITNPDITNPDITNPDITNPDITNPDITNPDITNPDITNPDITNPDITNGSVTDYTWEVKNEGNTSASYSIKLLLNGAIPPDPNFIITQLVLHKFYLTPVAANCTLAEEPHNVLIANIPNPQFTTDPADLANPDITNPDITNATLSLAPDETAKITLRVVDKNRFDTVTFNAATAVSPAAITQAVNTEDVAAGKTEPTVKVPPITIVTAALPAGEVGTAYQATVEASGGVGTRFWSSTPLPAGLTLSSDGINAFISGTPEVAGSFPVTFTVTDSATPAQTATKTLTLHILGASGPWTINALSADVSTVSGGEALAAGSLFVKSLEDPAGFNVQIARVIPGEPTILGTFAEIQNSDGSGILVDPQASPAGSRLIVADEAGQRIALVDFSESTPTVSTLFNIPWTMNPASNGTGQQQYAVDPDEPNILYFWDNTKAKLFRLDRDTSSLTELYAVDQATADGLHVTTSHNDIAFDPATGKLLLTDATSNSVVEITPPPACAFTSPACDLPVTPPTTLFAELPGVPRAIAVNALARKVFIAIEDSIYVGDRNGGLVSLVATGFTHLFDLVVSTASVANGFSLYAVDKAVDTVYEIRRTNSAPVTVGDSYTTPEDTQLVVPAPGILGNDTDADGDPLTPAFTSGTSSGTMAGFGDGQFTYSPNANFNGADAFQYMATDGFDFGNVATVTIDVTPLNDAPTLVTPLADVTVDEDAPDTNVDVSAAFADADTSTNADSLTFNVVSNSNPGLVVGTFSGAILTLDYQPNQNGTATLTVRATDSAAAFVDDTFIVTVNAVNDAPVAVDDSYTTGQGTTLNVPAPGVLANDTDVDGPVFQAVLVTQPASGTLTLNVDGSFTYEPGAAGTFTFTYRVRDSFVLSNIATVTLTVSLANTFFTFFDTAGNDVPQAIAPAPGGGYFVAGEVSSSPSDVWVAKVNGLGNVVWQKRFGGAGNDGSATAFGGRLATVDVAALSDGGAAVAATTDSFGAGGQDAWILRLDGDGAVVWQHTYGDSFSNAASSIAEVQPGVLAVLGTTFGTAGYDIWLLRLNDTAAEPGTVLSQTRFGGAQDDYGAKIVALADGGFVATGWTYSFGSAGELWVARLDNALNRVWFNTYGTGVFDGGSAIVKVPTGGYAVAGNMGGDAWVLRLNDGGDVTWQKTFDSGGASDIAWTIAADAFGGLFVGGLSSVGNGDPWLLGLNEATGAIRWQRIFGGGNFDQARALTVTGDGAVTFVGESGSFGFPNSGLVARLDPSGTVASCSLFIFDTSATVASPEIVLQTVTLAGTATGTLSGTPTFNQSDTTATESQRCPPAPDLIVESLASEPGDALSTEPITFTAKVKNIGLVAAGASTLLLSASDEEKAGPEQLLAVPALAPGESFTAQRQSTSSAGSHVARATADHNQEIAESNENNNQRTLAYTVAAPAPTEFTVTNTNDSGPGSLRRAIERANANVGFTDTIDFSILGAGPHTITPLSALPTISDPVIIDAPPTGDCSGAPPTIEIDGVSAGASFGLVVNSLGAGTIIRGLAITRFGLAAIFLNGGGNNVVECSYLGVAPDGVTAKGNTEGVLISGSTNNTIGGTTAAVRNVISANLAVGINIGAGSTGNSVRGNFIGTTADGAAARGNGGGGVLITAANNTVGGLTGTPGTGAGNVISGNTGDGVRIEGPGASSGIVVQGNIIGLGADGSTAIGNSSAGVRAHNAGVQVGGTAAGARNVIAGNSVSEVLLSNSGSTYTGVIQGNYIGTDITGTLDRGTATGVSVGSAPGTRIGGTEPGAGNLISGNGIGIFISNISHRAIDASGAACPSEAATCYNAIVQGNVIGLNAAGTAAVGNGIGVQITNADNLVGGTTAAARNIISGNSQTGVYILSAAATGNVVQGNFIGTTPDGTAALGNAINGVHIDEAPNNTIGGTATGARNVISANGLNGVRIAGGQAKSNQVIGNFVGTNAAGNAGLGNASNGVSIVGAANTQVGGTAAGSRNLISGNQNSGIFISGGAFPTNVIVQGNYIGVNADGTGAIANAFDGISIHISGNMVGGPAVDARNVISGNGGHGIRITTASASGNFVQGNLIGTDANGTAALGNGADGIMIAGGAGNNTIGGTVAGAKNVLSGNTGSGISIIPILGIGSSENVVQGNFIGTDVSGTLDLGNAGNGVHVIDGANNTIGGTISAARNVISGNNGEGVRIDGANATGNIVRGNYIGTSASGSADLGNRASGVYIRRAPSNSVIGNVVSGNNGFAGVAICGNASVCGGGDFGTQGNNASANIVQGNFVGKTADGLGALGNSGYGLSIDGAANTVVGGTASGTGNVITNNGAAGVVVFNPPASRNAINGNSISDNGGLGIDLGGDGVTLNDTGDGDGGPNNRQNFPVITSSTNTSSTRIQGTLNSTASTSFTLEFFANAACDPSGNGEGATLLGSTVVTTNSTGNASFDVTFEPTVPIGQFVTATATDPAGNTSEFSECKAVSSTVITFETPSLGNNENQIVNPYTASGVTFTSDSPTVADDVVGLSKNTGLGTSACVPPESSNQKLETTQQSAPAGYGVYPIRATFSSALPAGSTISVTFQTGGGETARLRLFNANNELVGLGTAVVPSVGVCPNNTGDPRGTVAVNATASQPVAYAVMDLASTTIRVFVIDNFTIQ